MKKPFIIIAAVTVLLTLLVGCGIAVGVNAAAGDTITVEYNLNGGTGDLSPSVTVPPGDLVSIMGPTANMQREGYVFTGWNTKADGSGDTYRKGEARKIEESTTIYAQWAESIMLDYDLNDGSGTLPDPVIRPSPLEVTISDKADSMERVGYVFTGWNTKADGTGEAYRKGEARKIEESTTIYAQWAEGIMLDYDLNDGSGSLPEKKSYPAGLVGHCGGTGELIER